MVRTICLHKTSQIGYRETNEDVEGYLINLLSNGQAEDNRYAPIDFFIVCDGHGGSSVSRFVVPRLQKLLTDRNLVYPLEDNHIIKIFNQVQNEIKNHPNDIGNGCGSTCLVVVRYLEKNKECIQVINIGDCRAILSRKGVAMNLNTDHQLLWPDEKKRIDEVNKRYGTNEKIHFESNAFRIKDLSVSRAFGDLDACPFLTHVPDVFLYTLEPNDEFIIIACDGLYDVMQSHEAVNFVRDHVTNNNLQFYKIPGRYPPNEVSSLNIARKLAKYALALGSSDNVSVLIVFLNR